MKSDEFFKAIAETQDENLFDSLSVKISITKAWNEQKPIFFICFVLPHFLLAITYLIFLYYVSS